MQSYLYAKNIPHGKVEEATESLTDLAAQYQHGSPYTRHPGGTKGVLSAVHSKGLSDRIRDAFRDPSNGQRWSELISGRNKNDASIHTIIPELISLDRMSWDVRGVHIGEPSDSAKLANMLRNPYMEILKAMFLDKDNKVVHSCVLSCGTLTGSLLAPSLYMREMGRLCHAGAIESVITSHNHPSGDPHPSAADMKVTRVMEEFFRAIGITHLDHVITNGSRGYSLAQYSEFVIPDQVMPIWEIVPRSDLKVLNQPDLAIAVADSLRQSSPSAIHVLLLDRKNKLCGVEVMSAKMQTQAIVRRTMEATGRSGASAFIPSLPGSLQSHLDLVKALKRVDAINEQMMMDVIFRDGTGAAKSLEESGINLAALPREKSRESSVREYGPNEPVWVAVTSDLCPEVDVAGLHCEPVGDEFYWYSDRDMPVDRLKEWLESPNLPAMCEELNLDWLAQRGIPIDALPDAVLNRIVHLGSTAAAHPERHLGV